MNKGVLIEQILNISQKTTIKEELSPIYIDESTKDTNENESFISASIQRPFARVIGPKLKQNFKRINKVQAEEDKTDI